MGAVKLELRCPQSVGGVVIDPKLDWSFSTSLSELISIEEMLSASAPFPSPFSKTKSRFFAFYSYEIEDDEEDSEEEAHDQIIVAGRRFTCDDFYISNSDDTEVELPIARYSSAYKVGLVEGATLELTHQREFSAKLPLLHHIDVYLRHNESSEFRFDGVKEVLQKGNTLKCAESARGLEERRQQIHKEIAIKNEELRLGYSTDPLIHGSKIRRLIRTISGLKDNARTRIDQLLEIFFDSSCPQPMSVAMFAEKIVDQCLIPKKSVFAYADVIVPLAMDLLVAQLNRACTYTVPKHITYSKTLFGTKEAYHKAIGYKENDGVIESEESYVLRIDSCMRLYGALVQTEGEGVQNIHGLTEGWAWLARFLNALPANLYTAVALLAFLEMAGFSLYRRYKAQFKKVLNIVYRDFLTALKERRGDAKLKIVITSIQSYLKSNKFLEEPEGTSLRSLHTLVSLFG